MARLNDYEMVPCEDRWHEEEDADRMSEHARSNLNPDAVKALRSWPMRYSTAFGASVREVRVVLLDDVLALCASAQPSGATAPTASAAAQAAWRIKEAEEQGREPSPVDRQAVMTAAGPMAVYASGATAPQEAETWWIGLNGQGQIIGAYRTKDQAHANTNYVVGIQPQPDASLTPEASSAPAQETERLEQLKGLYQGWDGYDARPIDESAIDNARGFLEDVNVVPCVSGGLQLEWHTHDFDIEIEFHPDGRVELHEAASASPAPSPAPSGEWWGVIGPRGMPCLYGKHWEDAEPDTDERVALFRVTEVTAAQETKEKS